MGKISNYARVLVSKLTDVFVCDQTDNGTTATKSATVEQIGTAIGTLQTFEDLDTSHKTLVDSINEVNDALSDVTLTTKTHCKYRKCQNGVIVLYIDGATDGEQLDIPTPANIGYYVGLNQSNNPTAFALKTTKALQFYGTGTSLYATIVYAATTN